MEEPSRKNTDIAILTCLSGLTIHVPDRSVNSHRKASSPWPTTHDTCSVASKKQLESTGITGEDHSNLQVLAPTLTNGGWRKAMCFKFNHYIHSDMLCKCLQTHQKKSSNTQHHSSVIYKQGRRHEVGPTLCSTMENRDLVYQKARDSQRLNLVADKLSRLGQTIQTEWFLLPEVFQMICSRWHRPQIYLPRGLTSYLSLCHQYRIPWPQQWIHSLCHGRIWTHTPSHQHPYWAKWWRSCRTPHARELF